MRGRAPGALPGDGLTPHAVRDIVGTHESNNGAGRILRTWGGRSMLEIQALIIWLIVGAIAGWAAGQVVKGGGFGLIGDIIVGIVGAFIAGFLLPKIGLMIGGGIIGAIINAFIGAVILLLILRLIKRA